jgi:hypothetical protein
MADPLAEWSQLWRWDAEVFFTELSASEVATSWGRVVITSAEVTQNMINGY